MTATCRNPLANPLTDRPFGNLNFGRMALGSYVRFAKPGERLDVPEAVPYGGETAGGAGLTVPNQDVPLGDQLRGAGFVGNGDLFRLSDGTVLDFKTRRILRTPDSKSGYWGDPDRTITMNTGAMTGIQHEPDINELIAHPERYAGTAMPDGTLAEPMDPRSAAYWLRAEEEAEKLKGSMTADQLGMLDDFERHFPKSRLIEESRKFNGGKSI